MKEFPAKILLFGEYSLVMGGDGLAVPYFEYSARLSFEESAFQGFSNKSIQAIHDNYKQQVGQYAFLDLEKMEKDLKHGLWLNSNIPTGYGLGSSGALIAALYDRYKKDAEENISLLMDRLAMMEGILHGTSSGVDPLVCLLQKAIHVKGSKEVEVLDEVPKSSACKMFLLDTHVKSTTKNLVDWFKVRLEENDFAKSTRSDLVQTGNSIINQLISSKEIPKELLEVLSRFQHDYLRMMVPVDFRKHFMAGLKSGDFVLKLCGSGGGGYLLCCAFDEEKTRSYFANETSRKSIFKAISFEKSFI